MKKSKPTPYTGEIKITTRIDRKGAKKLRMAKWLEEAAKQNLGKIKVTNFIASNVTSVSFEVSREKWQKIEQSVEWADVKRMIED